MTKGLLISKATKRAIAKSVFRSEREEALQIENERLRAVLSFYGDYLSYGRGKIRFEGERPEVMKDNGKQARAALEPKP